jgi:hypothetical protein
MVADGDSTSSVGAIVSESPGILVVADGHLNSQNLWCNGSYCTVRDLYLVCQMEPGLSLSVTALCSTGCSMVFKVGRRASVSSEDGSGCLWLRRLHWVSTGAAWVLQFQYHTSVAHPPGENPLGERLELLELWERRQGKLRCGSTQAARLEKK